MNGTVTSDRSSTEVVPFLVLIAMLFAIVIASAGLRAIDNTTNISDKFAGYFSLQDDASKLDMVHEVIRSDVALALMSLQGDATLGITKPKCGTAFITGSVDGAKAGEGSTTLALNLAAAATPLLRCRPGGAVVKPAKNGGWAM